MEFDNDVFISYAHVDNETFGSGDEGWISSFHRALEVRLSQLLGTKARVFRDPKLQGNDVFGDRLVSTLPRTAALVSILSPRYVKSEWCVRELVEFMAAAERSVGARVGTRSRVFKVVKTPIPLDQHPGSVQDLLGYDFFRVDRASGRPRELSQESPDETRQEYWSKLNDLAYDLREMIESLEARAAGHPEPSSNGLGNKEPIYLAECTSDLQTQRDRVRRFLISHGYRVLPEDPIPLVSSESGPRIREWLKSCCLSIHLSGATYGVVPEGGELSIPALQHQIATEHSSGDGGLRRLIWLPKGVDSEDERQQLLLQSLRTDSNMLRGADLLETPISELLAGIKERLKPPDPSGDAVFLATSSHDLDRHHDELERALVDRGYRVCSQRREDLPLVAKDCESHLRQQLTRCRLSVHFLGEHYGVVPDATDASLVELQHRLATERCEAKKDFRQLVWIPKGISRRDPRQNRFVEYLLDSQDLAPRLEIVEGDLNQLRGTVLKHLKDDEQGAASGDPADKHDRSRPDSLYLMCEESDLEALSPLEDWLFDQGFEVVLPLFEGDEGEMRQEHEEALRDCEGALIYYGTATEAWQRRMLREIRKSTGYGRSGSPPPVALILGPPETPRKSRLRTREAEVLKPQGTSLEETMKPFVERLLSLREGARDGT